MAIKQGIRKSAKNRNAKYKKKYTIAQTTKTSNNKQTTKYSYTKKITTNGKTRYYYA